MKTFTKQNLIGKNFLGEVVDSDDPEKEGRCRVRIFGMFVSEDPVISEGRPTGQVTTVELPVDTIPWASPANGKFFAGGETKGFGDISIPKVGTVVKVTFPNGDLYSPEWTMIQNPNIQAIEEIQDSYQGSHILLYDNDEAVKVFYTPGKGLNIFHKNSQIVVNPDSSITIEHADTQSLIELVGADINIVSQGTVNLTAQNDVNITAQTCNLDASSINLGEAAVESLVKGNTFKALFDTHVHMTTIPGSPTTPPIAPLPPNVLSTISKTQ
jgi:hypothetical protein